MNLNFINLDFNFFILHFNSFFLLFSNVRQINIEKNYINYFSYSYYLIYSKQLHGQNGNQSGNTQVHYWFYCRAVNWFSNIAVCRETICARTWQDHACSGISASNSDYLNRSTRTRWWCFFMSFREKNIITIRKLKNNLKIRIT